MSSIVGVLDLVQQTPHAHAKSLESLSKKFKATTWSASGGAQSTRSAFVSEFRDHAKRVLVVFKREPAVERLVSFITAFAALHDEIALDLLRVRSRSRAVCGNVGQLTHALVACACMVGVVMLCSSLSLFTTPRTRRCASARAS
jgi:hypothetical protein